MVRGNDVEHWRNGARVVSLPPGQSTPGRTPSPRSKFDWMPAYGLESEGHIALQAHGHPIWFRHIRIRPLAPTARPRAATP